MIDVIAGATGALLLGFTLGFVGFRTRIRWCGRCGAVKCCPNCAAWWRTTGVTSTVAHR
jgi:primosomal protein N'